MGVEWKKAGNLYKICCPFHNDSHPSLVVYPQDRGYCCYSCSRTGTWMDLYRAIKGCDWKEAYDALGVEGDWEPQPKKLKFEFVEDDDPKLVEVIKRRYELCSELPEPAIKFLKGKHLLEQAKELGWKWDTNNFKQSGGGAIVIPYRDGGDIISVRLRTLNSDGYFSKPKTLKGTKARPYPLLRNTDKLYIVEGESDALSLYASGCSVVAVPGAGQRKCINSAVLYSKLGYKTIVACGDNDGPGRMMNDLIKVATRNLTDAKFETLKINGYNDINDAFVAGALNVDSPLYMPGATLLTGIDKAEALFQFADKDERAAIVFELFSDTATANPTDLDFLSDLMADTIDEMKQVWTSATHTQQVAYVKLKDMWKLILKGEHA